ncbi:MAG: hypothetical protein WCL16_13785, partial [bacterium]
VAPDVGGSNTYVLAFGGGVPAYAATNNQTNAAGVFQLNQLVLNAGSGSNQIVGSGALVFTNTGAALQQVGMGQFRIAHKLVFTNDPAMITGNGAGNMYLASNVTVAAAGRVLLQGQGAWTMALQSSNNLDGTLGMDAPNATLQLESDMALNGASGGSVTVSNGTVNSQPASGNVAIGLNVSNRRLLLTGPYSVLRVNSRPPLMIGSVQSASSSNCNVTVDSGARLYGALNVSYTTAAYTGAVNGCSLVITNGGQVFNDNVTASIIGYAGVTNVAAIVTGPNSTWNLGGMNLVVATNLPATRNSSLTVRDGGLVTNANTLFLGGISNTVSVANAGSVSANTLTVGDGTNSSANTLAVDNATVAIANNLIIGNNGGRNNALTVQNGAIVNLRNGTLAWGAGAAANNFIVVDGTSCITNVGTLALNDAGRTVTLANGAVDGKNIQFSAGGGLLVGTAPNIAPVNLVISNFTLNAGGAFGFADSMVGNSSSPNNTLTVGSGGQWNLGGRTLTLGMIANPLSTSNNVLKIDGGGIGGGAIVRNIGFLYVGGTYPAPRVVGALATTGNSLIVTNGGMLVSSNANIGNPVGPGAGYTEYISNNTAVVTGSGSSWTNIGTICIGGANANAVCNSNACWITSSGRVYTANLYIGRDSAGGAGSMNVVQIDGAGTVVAVTT